MKTIQQLNFNLIQVSSDNADFVLKDPRFYFDPALYSGIQNIYFEVNTKYTGTPAEGQVELYNVSTSEVITTIDIDEAVWTRNRSADIKSSLTSACVLGLRMKRTSGTGSNQPRILGASLVIHQDDLTTSRKTACYFPLSTAIDGYWYGWWSDLGNNTIRIPLDSFNGTTTFRLEGYLKTMAGGTAEIRLYDVTADEEVADSNLTTNETVYTRVQTGNLTLQNDHQYLVQVRSQTTDKTASLYSAWLRVTSAGYNKTVSLPCVFSTEAYGYTASWQNISNKVLFDFDNIDGDDGLAYAFDWNWYVYAFFDWTGEWQLYDLTGSAVISGTYHSEGGSVGGTGFMEDTPVLPSAVSELVMQDKCNDFTQLGPGMILCYQQENFPSGPSLPADPSQPSGYHCFMSQFLRNLLNSTIPLETPDGVNKCWDD